MSEPSEIRLVRCPRCENLLPELKDYLVYRCGGCGAVLGAKIEKLEADTLSQKSEEERVRGGSDKFPEELDKNSFSEKGISQTDGSKSDVKFNGHYSRRADKMVLLGNTVDHQRDGSSTKFDRCGVGFVDTELEANSNLNESSRVEGGPPNGISNGFQKSGRVADWRSEEGDEIEGFQRNPTRDFHGVKYSNPMYPEDGPWNYKLMSSYGFGEALQNNQNKSHEFNKVEYLEQDRAELLRKLDELKDQLTQSCNVKEKPKEKFPHDQRWVHNEEPYGSFESQFRDSSWGSNRGPHYVRHYPEPSPYKIRQEMEMHSFCPSMHAPNQAQRFGDPIRSQVPRRGPLQAPSAHRQQSSHPYFSGQYQYRDMDPFEPYPPNMNFHHPSCSCLRCYSQQRVPAPVPPAAAFHNRMAPNAQNDLMFYHSENPSAFGPRDHNPRIGNPPPLNSTNLQSNTTWPSNLNSEADGFVHCRPHRGVLATHGRHCHPIAGGAPFVTCYNCLELLLLPKKMLLVEKNQKKVRCGGCSAVILSTVVDNKLVVSVQSMTGRTPNIIGDSPIAAIGGCTLHSRVHANPRANFSSGDYDDSVYDFQSMNREVVSSSNGYKSGVGSVHSTSAYSSEAEGNIINLNAQVEESNSVGPVEESNLSPPAAGSPLQDHFDYSTQYRVVNRLGKGSQSGHSEREKIEDPKKVTSRQNSMKDVSLETEMDVSFSEYSNTGTSQDSGDTSREEQARGNKGGQSIFAGIMKKSFKDSTKSNQSIEQSSRNVTVNGHLMSDRLLKKAEKLSGPIQSGQYWYDSRAGFWGVMGGPCLGIIPPFIEEFNSPMPENCAGGNTSVFVNGRELNLRDLNLLSSRGLPTTRDRSYIIEISGRVLDEDSGEELDSLGKLAPTIEKVKHGFGMKVPRVAA